MAFVSGDRILETSTTTGAGATITLAGAVAGYRAFSAVATANGDRFVYVIAGGIEWEVGIGTRTAATTFTRDSILSSSNAGAIVTLSAGTKLVWIDDPAKLSAQSMLADVGANILINGRMEVGQERGGASVTITSGNLYVCDQWIALENAGSIGVTGLKGTPPGTPPFGNQFTQSIRLTASTGGAIAAGERVVLFQPIEGIRMAKLGYGGTTALPTTLGFWVYSTITGQSSIFIQNSAANRSFVKSFQINAAATWEYKTISIAGDTSGSWNNDTGTVGANVGFGIAVGSSSFGTDNTWNAANNIGVSGQTNLFASTNNVFAVTGVAWLAGDLILPEHLASIWGRSFDEELHVCERFWEKSFNYATVPAQNVGLETGEYSQGAIVAGASVNRFTQIRFAARKASNSITFTFYNPSAANGNARDGTLGADCGAPSLATPGEDGFRVNVTGNASTSISNSIHFHWVASARLL
jgi:hypothetical protein